MNSFPQFQNLWNVNSVMKPINLLNYLIISHIQQTGSCKTQEKQEAGWRHLYVYKAHLFQKNNCPLEVAISPARQEPWYICKQLGSQHSGWSVSQVPGYTPFEICSYCHLERWIGNRLSTATSTLDSAFTSKGSCQPFQSQKFICLCYLKQPDQ